MRFERAAGEKVFTVHIVNLRNTYQFTPRFFIRAIAQFDSAKHRALGDFLASYELMRFLLQGLVSRTSLNVIVPGRITRASRAAQCSLREVFRVL